MNKVSTSPLVAGIKAARDNAIPLVVILLAEKNHVKFGNS
jgi:hypothetical protein